MSLESIPIILRLCFNSPKEFSSEVKVKDNTVYYCHYMDECLSQHLVLGKLEFRLDPICQKF